MQISSQFIFSSLVRDCRIQLQALLCKSGVKFAIPHQGTLGMNCDLLLKHYLITNLVLAGY